MVVGKLLMFIYCRRKTLCCKSSASAATFKSEFLFLGQKQNITPKRET